MDGDLLSSPPSEDPQTGLGRTFIRIAKSSSEGSSHFHIAVLQVFEEQLLDGDGLAVHLVGLALVASHRPGQNQDVLEEEDVEFLKGKTYPSMSKALCSMQSDNTPSGIQGHLSSSLTPTVAS